MNMEMLDEVRDKLAEVQHQAMQCDSSNPRRQRVRDPDAHGADGNGLDCRRKNLRVCDKAQNAANMHARRRPSGIRGVHWHKAAGKWCAQLRHRNKRHYLGLFATEVDAARAYDAKARELWGEFANTNYGVRP